MTETEYILLKNLANITIALYALRETMAGFDGVVTDDELRKIISQLAEWQEKAHKKVKVAE